MSDKRQRGRSGRPKRPSEQQAESERQQQTKSDGDGLGWRHTIDSFGGFLTVGSVVAALLVVAVLIFVNRPGGDDGSDTAYVPQVREQVNGRVLGDSSAPVRIIEFSDFQCPVCKRYTDDTAPILDEEFVETGIASIEYWHLPVINEDSITAAEAAECALDQDMFWPFHDLMFQKQGGGHNGSNLSTGRLKDYAAEMAAAHPDRAWDQDVFDGCLDSGVKREVVAEHQQAAAQVGASSTPSFLINGRLMAGLNPVEVMRQAIEQAATEAGS